MNDDKNNKILIDPTELMSLILEYPKSDEFKNIIANSVFDNKQDCQSAIIFGMSIASLLICKCNKFEVVELNIEK